MKQRPRIYYTEEQKAMMWDRWQKGETLGSIARLFDRHHPSIERIIAETGGIRVAAHHDAFLWQSVKRYPEAS